MQRLASVELIGAEVYLLETPARHKSYQGSVALIVGKSESVISIVSCKDLTSNGHASVVKLNRKEVSFAFLLPSKSDEARNKSFPTTGMTSFVSFFLENNRSPEVSQVLVTDEILQPVPHDSYQFISFSSSAPNDSVSPKGNDNDESLASTSNVEGKEVRKNAVVVVKGSGIL